MVGASGNTGTNSTSNAATGGTAVAKTSEPMTTDKCAQSNGIVRRGFQIMGPEAVKTFNQDDRLILAMSTSARPLISTIKDVASRLTSTRPASAADLKPLSDERVRVLQAERAVEQANAQSGADVTSVVDAAITALEGGNTQ